MLRECLLWRDFKKLEGNVRRTEDAIMKEAINLRGDHWGRMWPRTHTHVWGDL